MRQRGRSTWRTSSNARQSNVFKSTAKPQSARSFVGWLRGHHRGGSAADTAKTLRALRGFAVEVEPFAGGEKRRPAARVIARRGVWGKIPAATYSPTRKPCSTIGSGGLNFRVRDGNGWSPSDVATGNFGICAIYGDMMTSEGRIVSPVCWQRTALDLGLRERWWREGQEKERPSRTSD